MDNDYDQRHPTYIKIEIPMHKNVLSQRFILQIIK